MENDINNYRFLSNGDINIIDINDSNEFKVTISAMQIMGFQCDEISGEFLFFILNIGKKL